MHVLPLPARTCLFFKLGHCVYEAALNPGHNADHRCVRVARLLEDWDGFMDRAEAFGLSLEMAARIWNSRRHAALTSRSLCPDTEAAGGGEENRTPSAEEEILDCVHLYHGACLLAMPDCSGRCGHFRLPGGES